MDEKFLIPRIDDLKSKCERTDSPQFLGFLSEAEVSVCKNRLLKSGFNISFFGGFQEAVRCYVCVSPPVIENPVFPITAVTFTYRKQDKLSHRDFLGAVMALQIQREKIGDILVEDGRAVVFADKNIAEHIVSEIDKVGRVGVNVKIGCDYPLPELGKKVKFSDTVASNRLDCIVGALCGTSRSKAIEIIEEKNVCVNSFLSEKSTQKVFSGDKISIRKKGRFDIVSVEDISKKGRIILIYEKYI